jgi:hypothetical protein
MSSVIKISNQPFREDICRSLPDVWNWVLSYRYKIDNSIKIRPCSSLQDAKDLWNEMLSDTWREPLAIQPRKFHIPYVPEGTFNSSWSQLRSEDGEDKPDPCKDCGNEAFWIKKFDRWSVVDNLCPNCSLKEEQEEED